MGISERNNYDSHIAEKANTSLARRLRELITDTQALAEHLNVSIQAVNQYKQGTAFPKVENIIKIADYYDISVDYLFGITDIRNRNTSIQAVGTFTGLSEGTIRFLNTMRGTFFPKIIDFLLNDARFTDGDGDSLIKLIRFFLEYNSGNHPVRRINVHGDISETPSNGLRTDAIMLDENIVENAVLEEIKNRLLQLKKGYSNGKH